MAAPRRSPLLETMWKIHKWLWRISNGRLLNRAVGMPVLELVTTGRRSGEPRSVLLTYLDTPEGWAVIGSNAGDDRAPAWWRNLEAKPDATVRIAGIDHAVRARAADGAERTDLWDRAVAAHPGYADYARYTDRTIPVVVLERTG